MRRSSSKGRVTTAGSLLLLLFLLMAGCAATQVQKVWTDENYQGGRLKSVLVIVLVSNPTARMKFESEFAKHFKYHGIKAVESFRSLEMETLTGKGSRDAIIEKLTELGYDAVTLTRVVENRTKEDIIPGMTISTGFGYAGAYAGASYVFSGPSDPTTQSYTHEEKFLGLETSLFSAKTEKLIWSARSETRITTTAVEEISPYVSAIAGKLLREPFFK
jgi:hypothetical protein